MFEGNLIDGELEIGQIAGLIHEIKSAEDIITEMISEYSEAQSNGIPLI
jgi:enoyl-[acyl-carrier protein] reductase II